MSYAIGCIGTSADLRTRQPKQKMTRAVRARNSKLVPKRNQTRDIGFILISRDGEAPKVRAIRAGHSHHYITALVFAKVEVAKDADGKPLIVKRPK